MKTGAPHCRDRRIGGFGHRDIVSMVKMWAVEVTHGDGPKHGMTHGHRPAVGMWGPYNSGECFISTELTGTGPAYLT